MKKYKSNWGKTLPGIIFMCEHIENMLKTQRADLIFTNGDYRLVKLDFAIFGTKMSPKKSGNRCILVVDDKLRLVRILLVYAKTDLPSKNETQQWKNIVREEYKDLAKIFGL
ncbi:hypothetical protein IJG92_00490 [Candidatus Saccharibacteria bacterium]|nr:hypothetical protein [Candidatus Saccharibacteria bacterium]